MDPAVFVGPFKKKPYTEYLLVDILQSRASDGRKDNGACVGR